MPIRKYYLLGKRYGKLVVIGQSDPGNDSRRRWICQCDCGNVKNMRADRLVSGKGKSCGCLQTANIDYSVEKEIIRRYKYSAKNHGRAWELSDEYALGLLGSKCYYCGDVGIRKSRRKIGQVLKINGIDRMNNSLGYIYGNVVSCCSICNYIKREVDHDEFLQWIAQVYKHRISK